HARLLEMSLRGGREPPRRDAPDQPELEGVVSVVVLRLALDDQARPGFDDGDRHDRAVRLEDLGHPDLASQNSVDHVSFLASSLEETGRSRFPYLPIVRISNCSRDFLSTCGERFTVQRAMVVGSGIGPATFAPERRAVSTISVVDWSRIR